MKVQKFGTDYQACAHSFTYASKEDEGENYGRRMFYYRDTIYSYGHHFIIAKKVRSKSGEVDFILVNNDSNSTTTNKQQSAVNRALFQTTIAVHTDIEYFNPIEEIKVKEREILNTLYDYSRARAEHIKDDYIRTIKRKLEDISFLVDYYRIKSKTSKRILNYLNFLHDTDELLNVLSDGNVKRSKTIERQENAKEKRRLAQLKEDQEKELVKIQDWKEGKEKRIYSKFTDKDYLRISEDGLQIETSQGVGILINEAKRLLHLIDGNKIIGATIDDKFIVTGFNGLLKVGCHNIPIEEINEIREHI
jgi:hypothetical protein